MEQISLCPKCKSNIEATDFFCRVCGFKVAEKSLSTSFFKQLSIYAISLFLPPFGLIPAIKYLRQEEEKSKKVGIIAIVITLISVIISIWLLFSSVSTFNNVLNEQKGNLENLSF